MTTYNVLINRDRQSKRLMIARNILLLTGVVSLISCGGGKKEGARSASGNAILPSAPKLTPPAVTFPPETVHPSNASALTISGSCTSGPGAKIFLGGDENQETPCTDGGTFSFVVSNTNDGTFSYTLREESLVHHPSEASAITWMRSTIAPPAPTITGPATHPFLSGTDSLTLGGGCVAGNTVSLAEDSTQTTTCSENGTYSFLINKTTDGTFTFDISQTDIYGNLSPSVQTSWTRNTAVPPAPQITTPVNNPYTSNNTDLTLAGTCSSGTTIKLSGQTTASTGCSNGTFSFDLSEAANGTYNYSIVAVSVTNISSAATNFQWTVNVGVPNTPVLSAPLTSTIHTNSTSLVIAGSCTDGNTVYLTGGASDSVVCASSSFSFTVTKTTDATYNLSVYQQDSFLQNSGAVGVTWTLDTLPPLAPIITSPGISPYYSSSSTLVISGVCESGANVNLSGDATNMLACTSGSFSFQVSKTNNATYSLTLTQTDSAGNQSSSASLQWTLDTVPPSAPTITTPASSPVISNGNSFTIAGACENSATVNLTGSSSQSLTCASNTYSFSVSKTSDASYTFSVAQTDLAGQTSPSSSVQWVRDTVAPSAPAIVSPSSNPLTSNDTNLTISGTCESDATVTYSGSSSGSTSCTAGTYSFSVSKSIDGSYSWSIIQTDTASNNSASTSFQWTRLSTIPTTPTISAPTANPHYGKLTSVTLSGTCTTGNTVQLSGALSQTTTCSNNTFSFSLTKTSDGTYNFDIAQINASQISSGLASFTWVLDRTSPSTPVVSSPNPTSVTNAANSLTISGNCEANATVNYSGGATGSLICGSNSTFSFSVSKATDGIYTFSLSQTDRAGNASGSASVTWRRDTLAPATPSLTQPSSNPFSSGDSTLTIEGGCEANASVTMTGASSQTTTCSALGIYSFSVSKTTDATYNFVLTQTDLAGNTSTSLNFQWIRDTTVPFTPVVVSPATTTYRSNTSTITISVTCITGLTPDSAIVHLTGVPASDVISPAGVLDQNCITSPVSYTIQKTVDGTYDFTLNQENPNNSNISADVVVHWTRDTVAPAMPTITSPSTSPYTGPGSITLVGGCENNASVKLTGDATQTTTCNNSSYSFNIIKSTDATYNFSVNQTDLAGNISPSKSQTWIRNSDSLPPPTVTNPTTNPYADNAANLTLSGTCQPDYTVAIAGDIVASEVTNPTNSLTQICSSAGTYTFDIAKTVDGTYNLGLTESYNGATSASTDFTWTRDTTAPTVTISTAAPNPNLVTSITFSFSANESVTFQCKIGSGSYQSCTSPTTYSGLNNGANTFSVIATDDVGNIGAETSYSWTQAAYSAVALYHMAAGTATALNDSGLFTSTGTYINNLTSYGSPATNTGGKLPTLTPRSFTLGTGKYFSAGGNASFNSLANKMTLEGLFYFSSLSSTSGNYYTLFSQTGASAPNLGWELRLERQSGSCTKWKLKFIGSLDGSTQTTIPSSCTTVSTGRWYYIVVTWDNGTVKFNLSSSGLSSRGSGVIGTAGSAVLSTPNVPLLIGAGLTSGTGSSLWISGSVDEVRVSNSIRTLSYPSAEYTAD